MQTLKPWLNGLAYSELQERYAFYLEEPWGYEVDNYRMGTLASIVANVAGNKTKPADFYPQSLTPKRSQTSKQKDASQSDPQGLLDMFRAISPSTVKN